jgi:hypothetical protein
VVGHGEDPLHISTYQKLWGDSHGSSHTLKSP